MSWKILFSGVWSFLLCKFEWGNNDGDEDTSISWNDNMRESEKNGKILGLSWDIMREKLINLGGIYYEKDCSELIMLGVRCLQLGIFRLESAGKDIWTREVWSWI